MKAEIITIGDELLIGQVVDTNSAWIAQQLNLAGIFVYQITSVSDNAVHILAALREATQRADVVLLTGGLGPTKDDITKHMLAKYFGSASMVLHQPSLDYITAMFAKRGIALTDLNRRQAEVPDNCEVITNDCGTAPGMWFEHNDKVYISMPGVPSEMKAMLTKVIERLRQKFHTPAIVHKTLMSYGIPESLLAEKIEKWEDALPDNLKLAYLPDIATGVKLRLSAYGNNGRILEEQVNDEFSKLVPQLGNAFYGYAPCSLEEVVGNLLRDRKATLATAESCTGGRVAHLITSVAGSSDYFKGSIIAYSNEIKTKILGVDEQLIASVGAVSRETVMQMAQGARQALNTDYAVATSGVAGPSGGTAEKPVGLCWFAISTPYKGVSCSKIFTSDRTGNIIRASAEALNYLRLTLMEE